MGRSPWGNARGRERRARCAAGVCQCSSRLGALHCRLAIQLISGQRIPPRQTALRGARTGEVYAARSCACRKTNCRGLNSFGGTGNACGTRRWILQRAVLQSPLGSVQLYLGQSRAMHMNLRILREHHSSDYSPSEEQQLRDCISSAPGISVVTRVTRHDKGGYSVTFDGISDRVEEMLAHISAAGYTPVL